MYMSRNHHKIPWITAKTIKNHPPFKPPTPSLKLPKNLTPITTFNPLKTLPPNPNPNNPFQNSSKNKIKKFNKWYRV